MVPGVVHIFWSSGCSSASPPIEKVGPAPVFETAFDGEQGVGTRLRPAVFGWRNSASRALSAMMFSSTRVRRPVARPFAGLRKSPRNRPMLNLDAPIATLRNADNKTASESEKQASPKNINRTRWLRSGLASVRVLGGTHSNDFPTRSWGKMKKMGLETIWRI